MNPLAAAYGIKDSRVG